MNLINQGFKSFKDDMDLSNWEPVKIRNLMTPAKWDIRTAFFIKGLEKFDYFDPLISYLETINHVLPIKYQWYIVTPTGENKLHVEAINIEDELKAIFKLSKNGWIGWDTIDYHEGELKDALGLVYAEASYIEVLKEVTAGEFHDMIYQTEHNKVSVDMFVRWWWKYYEHASERYRTQVYDFYNRLFRIAPLECK